MNSLHRWPLLLRIAGIVLLVAGLQAWGFHRSTTPQFQMATEQLELLQHEVADKRLINLSLQSLQAFWRSTDDELTRRQAIELRDSVIERYASDPVAATADLAHVAGEFDTQITSGNDALVDLQRRTAQLRLLYEDHFSVAIARYSQPAWYLQPTAAFLNRNDKQRQALAFNHAKYLVHTQNLGAAIEILDSLRRDSSDKATRSKSMFALSRLQYQAFRVEGNDAYFHESLELAQQSVRADDENALAKMFLDYLLSVDRRAVEVDETPTEGEGTGEGEGDRGAIATDPGEF